MARPQDRSRRRSSRSDQRPAQHREHHLLLVSADFLNSDYCYDVELIRAMERHEQGDARILPVILRPCDWHGAPFGKLRAVPADGKPVVKHATLDEGFLEVAQAIREVAGETSRIPAPSTSKPVSDGEGIAPRGPRSSNLRVRRDFADHDRYAFLRDAFEYISPFFENSLSELQERNEQVQSDFRKVDDDGYTLFLKPLGMARLGQQHDDELTMEGAAEYFWDLFVERLR